MRETRIPLHSGSMRKRVLKLSCHDPRRDDAHACGGWAPGEGRLAPGLIVFTSSGVDGNEFRDCHWKSCHRQQAPEGSGGPRPRLPHHARRPARRGDLAIAALPRKPDLLLVVLPADEARGVRIVQKLRPSLSGPAGGGRRRDRRPSDSRPPSTPARTTSWMKTPTRTSSSPPPSNASPAR